MKEGKSKKLRKTKKNIHIIAEPMSLLVVVDGVTMSNKVEEMKIVSNNKNDVRITALKDTRVKVRYL